MKTKTLNLTESKHYRKPSVETVSKIDPGVICSSGETASAEIEDYSIVNLFDD